MKAQIRKIDKTVSQAGTIESTYGRLEHNCLIYKNKSYKVLAVNPYGVEVDTDKFEGRYGDEFPFNRIK